MKIKKPQRVCEGFYDKIGGPYKGEPRKFVTKQKEMEQNLLVNEAQSPKFNRPRVRKTTCNARIIPLSLFCLCACGGESVGTNTSIFLSCVIVFLYF